MREIKFRAWNPGIKKMMMVSRLGWFWACKDRGIWENNGISAIDAELHNGYERIEGYPCGDCLIMQFTGLFDKNGKEIYEGDILKPINPPSQKKDNRFVEYVDGSFCYNDKYNGSRSLNHRLTKLFLVIGNIYENPELLKNNS